MSQHPLGNLDYFAEWGGAAWVSMVRTAAAYLTAGGINDLDVLEIGTRYGKMAQFFSALGANVTAIDISKEAICIASDDARKRHSQYATKTGNQPGEIRFLVYDGTLDIFEDQSFDVIFTKSVLVVVPHLEDFLACASRKLKPGGRVAFIENAKGNAMLHGLRALRHRKWNYRVARYFTSKEIQLFESLFDVEKVQMTWFPPICLLLGKRRL